MIRVAPSEDGSRFATGTGLPTDDGGEKQGRTKMTYTIRDAGSHSGTFSNLSMFRPYTSRGWLLASVAPMLHLDTAEAVWVRGDEWEDGDFNPCTDWYLYACQSDADADSDGSAALLVAVAS